MFLDSMYVDAAIAISEAKRENDASWENINKHFRECTCDRRYKVWFCCCTDSLNGFWRIGSHKFLLEFNNENIYVRPVSELDKYNNKPCYEVKRVGRNGYSFEWQREVLI